MYILKYLLPIFLFLSCDTSEPDDMEPPTWTPPVTNTLTYLALGDSYTIGEKVGEEDRFPNLLNTRLKGLGFDLTPTPRIIAQTGWRTDNLQVAIEGATLTPPYDLVSLLIGVNNQFQGRPIDEYETEFLALLEKAIELAGGRNDKVFVLSIPDYAFTPFGQSQSDPELITEEIEQFNEVNKRIAEEKEVAYFNITAISRQGLGDETLLADDGLHPSGKMYAIWVNLMVGPVASLLE